MGDKSTARDTMKNAGVPTVPGSDGLLKVPHLIILSIIIPKRYHLDCFEINFLSFGSLVNVYCYYRAQKKVSSLPMRLAIL